MAKNAIIRQKVAITPPQPAVSKPIRSAQTAAFPEPIRKVRLVDVVDVNSSIPTSFQGQHRYVSTGALDVDHIDETNVELVDFKNRPSRANLQPKVGDVLFAKMQATRKAFIVTEQEADTIFSTGFYSLSPHFDELDSRYLWHYLNSDCFQAAKDKECHGVTQKALNGSGLSKLTLSICTLPAQRAIAEELDRICELKRTAEKLVEKYRLLIKAKFSEMFGDVTESRVGWAMRSLNSVCDEIVDCPHTTPNYMTVDTGFGCIRTSIIRKEGIQWSQLEYIEESEYLRRIARHEPRIGDIVYLREGGVLGIAAVINRKQKVALGQRTMLLSPRAGIVVSDFLSCAMNSLPFYNRATRQIGCSTAPHLNVADIKAFEISIPPLALQQEFAAFVEKVEKLEAAAKATVEKYDLLYRSKLQEYFG